MSESRVTVYGQRQDGARNLGLEVGGIRVLLTPPDEEHQVEAGRLAAWLLEQEVERGTLLARLRAAEEEAETLRGHLQRAREAVRAADERANAAIAGRRRFFGPVLLQPARAGDWTGEVWLLDPEKQGRGSGLRFASLAEVRAMHPELWVVGVAEDGILLDAWGEP
jgi:hypothetical protein